MTDRDKFEEEKQATSIAQDILDAAAKEMGFAVDSIRHELVEKGWFGKEAGLSPNAAGEWLRDEQEDPDILQSPQEKEFSWSDLYGRDPDIESGRGEPEQERDLDQDLEQ